MKKKIKDVIVIGFALFAMFFGAGNLIFPPSLGNMTGSSYLLAMIGFILTGVGLPLLGILACANYDGQFSNITDKIGTKFSLIVNMALMIVLGPLLVIPRTAATTYELGVQPLFGDINPLVIIIIYFIINLFFVLKPSSIIDIIGTVLTPTLLVMLSSIIIKGIVSPFGEIAPSKIDSVFPSALLEGYQTMDVLGSVILAAIVVASIKAKGYKKKNEIINLSLKAGLISVTGLALIYGGLTYLGAQTSAVHEGVSRSFLVITVAKSTLGTLGMVALGIAVSLACLTTSIGVSATVCEYFSNKFEKLSYKTSAFILTAISIFIASMGVDSIVKFAVPILGVLYPLVIVLLLTSFIYDKIGKKVMAYTTYTALTIGVLNTLADLASISKLKDLLNIIPLNQLGFGWVLPSLFVFIITFILVKSTETKATEREVCTE
ncbi:branched-chain amino acid transport system II carrier protein [Oceanirhabdus sp. W0125-5]|uniref:branched-chain amino acid transport system II carrier protein n=1 Tax=Oceanirhabdus sp. W0125-5 TaxID=2999116 RepID=UPI0022F321D4|nr:branched-chain amino acid transport system II carrier protein [Oceanirhabdus sp. W0125-5]WBW99120.1 branched-chain amino acid transport system II carrier protein [Oceanirhabdus sp. W0125-5]